MGAYASVPERNSSSGQLSSAGMFASSTDHDISISKKKKQKTSKFASLKRRLWRSKGHRPDHDYAKAFRDMASSWTVREIHSLIDEYEAMSVLRELTALADVARPHATSVVEDLLVLYQLKHCTDVDLVYRGTTFPAHRAILCIRCPFFRELLAHYPERGAQVPVDVRTPGVDVQLFSALLRYLYTGHFGLEDTQLVGLKKLLTRLASEFGAPNSLKDDLRTLMDTGAYYDAVLIFSNEPEVAQTTSAMSLSGCSHGDVCARHDVGGAGGSLGVVHRCRNEIRCHRAILAARSTFFRNLVLRKARSGEELAEHALHSPSHIVLDESIIPRRYAQVLVGAIYLDTIDLSCILRSSVSLGTLSEVQAMVSGRGHLTATDEAMELYHIAKFLEFNLFAQGCEDIIVDSLTVDSLISTMQWSAEAYGSGWVHRQALLFLKEEFLNVVHSQVLCDLTKEHLMEAISSDFVQASELDILSAVVKWGEFQLVKRIEEREPNLLSHTTHSISRKGVRKRDMNDGELREILADILPYIRSGHLIPTHGDAFTGAVRRGLVCCPAPFAAYDSPLGHSSSAGAWVRTRNMALYVRPRLFLPYYQEAKAMLKELLSKGSADSAVVPLRLVHTCAKPDTLYMLPDRLYSTDVCKQLPPVSSGVDIIAATVPDLDRDVILEMKTRETEFMRSSLAQRAFSLLFCDQGTVVRLIRLRVVREFGLPNEAVRALEDATDFLLQRQDPCQSRAATGGCCVLPQRGRRPVVCRHRSVHLYRFQQPQTEHGVPLVGSSARPGRHNNPAFKNSSMVSDCCHGQSLRNAVPDVAMATATLNLLSMQGSSSVVAHSDLELDLGDGANHSGTGAMYM